MSDDTIFNDGTQTNDGIIEPPKSQVVLPDSVKDLVGEGKKYATVEKALEALVHAQKHIVTLEADNRTVREQVEKSISAEDVYNTVQELLKKERETHAPVSMDESMIANLLDRKIEAQRQKEVSEANVAAVKKALRDKYGDKAAEVYRARAAELGIEVGFLNGLAEKSSSAVLEYFGIKPSAASVPSRAVGSVNTDALANVIQPQNPPKSVMGGATTKQVTNAWLDAKKRVIGE